MVGAFQLLHVQKIIFNDLFVGPPKLPQPYALQNLATWLIRP